MGVALSGISSQMLEEGARALPKDSDAATTLSNATCETVCNMT
jgi:hypothetical protein